MVNEGEIRVYTVYVHRNLKNGKSYVGMTSRKPNERWRSGWGYKNNLRMWNDIQNSDWNKDWKHNIIGQFEDKQEALNAEEMFIWLFDSTNEGYNISTYDRNSYKRTDETRRKSSESMTGEKNPMYGKHHSEDTKRKMSEAHKEKIYANTKPILQFSKDGEFIAEYPSIMEASRQTGCNNSHIGSCCKGERKSAGGFIWKYKKSKVFSKNIRI